MTDTAGPRLADRYGSPRRGARVVLLVAGVVALSFAGWLAWSTWAYSSPEVTSELQGWEASGPYLVTATVDVQRSDADVVATCTVRAYAEDHTVVGERPFTVPGPDADGRGPVAVTVRTERAATAVQLVGCTTPAQSRPR